jgi:hypothetical protein
MSGVPTTQKANLQTTGNLILAGAGTANFVPAALANLAYNVVNSNQANITRLGTLNINTFKVSGGLNGQYMQTDGTGNLAWVSGGGSGNGVVGGANTQIQYNNAGNFGGSSGLTWNGSTGVLSTLNLSVSSGATIYGNTALTNLNVAGNLTSNNIFTDNYYYANGYVFSGGGNGTPGGSNTQVQFNNNGVFGGNTGFTFNKTTGLFNITGNISGGNLVTGGQVVASGNVSSGTGLSTGGFLSVDGTADLHDTTVTGNLSATGNITATNLGNISSINLTGSNSNVLYGNGVFAAVAGGANTGNVTFSDQVVMGTGSNDGTGGLYLAPGNASIANSAVQYLRVRGGDVVTHIHLDTGNNAFYDQYFGADSRYVKLEANGNVVINADDYAGNGATWTLDTTGNLTLPNDANIAIYGNTTQFNSCPNGFLGLNTYDAGGNNIARVSISSTDNLVSIGISDPITEIDYNWFFSNGGNLTLPGNLVIAGNANVFGIDAALIQQNDGLPIVVSSSGANGAVATYWVEDVGNVGTSNIAAVYVRPTLGSNIVRIAVGQNGNAGPNLWDFGTTGNLTLPTNGHIIVSGGIVGGGASPAPYISGFDSIGSLEFTNGNSNVTVTANASSWTFGTNGNLILPQGGIVTNSIPLVTFDILYQYDDLVWSGNTLTFTNASSTYMLAVLALMEVGDAITLGGTSTTVTGVYTGGGAGTFTVSGTGAGQQIAQFTLPNRLTSANGIKLTTNAKNYLFTEAGVTQSPVLTVDTLPSGQFVVAGFRAFVSDSNLSAVGNFGAIIGNSGSNTVCVWCDGTNWRIG